MALNIKYISLAGGGILTAAGTAIGISYLPKGKSMREELTAKGKKLIIIKEGYPAVFDVFKDDGELINLINKVNPEVNSGTENGVAGEALEQWCNNNLENYQSDQKIRTWIERYCTKAPETYEEKLVKQGKQLVNAWNTKLTSIKALAGHEKLLTDLKAGKAKSTSLNDTDAPNALRDWCDLNIKKQLSDTQVKEPDLIARCFN